MQPLVSVIVPCYNHAKYISLCIRSIIEQTYNNIELIIIDDGSSDESNILIEGLISECKQRFKRFKYIRRPNRGLCNTLNEGLEWCKGKYVAPVASDDLWLLFKTQIQVEFLEGNENAVGVFGGVSLINSNSQIIRNIERSGRYDFTSILLHKYFLPAPTALLRLDIVKKIGYDPEIKIEDWNMWLKITDLTHGYLFNLGGVVAQYRQHEKNTSNDTELMYKYGIKILKQFEANSLYSQAIASYTLEISASCARNNKKAAINYLFKYLKIHRISRRMILVLVKIIIPSKIAEFIKK